MKCLQSVLLVGDSASCRAVLYRPACSQAAGDTHRKLPWIESINQLHPPDIPDDHAVGQVWILIISSNCCSNITFSQPARQCSLSLAHALLRVDQFTVASKKCLELQKLQQLLQEMQLVKPLQLLQLQPSCPLVSAADVMGCCVASVRWTECDGRECLLA